MISVKKLPAYLIGTTFNALSFLAIISTRNSMLLAICLSYFLCSISLLAGLLTDKSYAVRPFIVLQISCTILLGLAAIVFKFLQMFFDYCTRVYQYHTIPHYAKYCLFLSFSALGLAVISFKLIWIVEKCCQEIEEKEEWEQQVL